ncbi:MAG: hypothetical protein WC091_22370 [Sulfuricellaceae bacterium]
MRPYPTAYGLGTRAVGCRVCPAPGKNRTLQPVQLSFLVTYLPSLYIVCEECVVDQAVVRFSG